MELPSRHSHQFSLFVSLAEGCDDDREEGDVDHHHEKDWEVEEIKELVSFWADEASLVSYLSIEVGLWRKTGLQDEKDDGQDHPEAPPTHRVEQKSEAV